MKFRILRQASDFDQEGLLKLANGKLAHKLDFAWYLVQKNTPIDSIRVFESRLAERKERRERKLKSIKDKLEQLARITQEDECMALQRDLSQELEKNKIRFPEDPDFNRIALEVKKATRSFEDELANLIEANRQA